MKTVNIKYNPYLNITEINVDGEIPAPNSALNIPEGMRLQEWVDNLPKILKEEYRDDDYDINYHGLATDCEDVRMAFENFGELTTRINLIEVPCVSEAEKRVTQIFDKIQNGPIDELKEGGIAKAFETAMNQQFQINVVATMSSGKSTLINAMLGQMIMPAANEATTATIVRISDSDNKQLVARAFDKSGNEIEYVMPITLDIMKRWNGDERVTEIHLDGEIPFVDSNNMKLVLVDTPGPNNSRDERHRDLTYRMLNNSDDSLVLFVMNGQQLGINDEKNLLKYVCDSMEEKGKQSRDRFIFAVNKLDEYSPKKEGENCIHNALNNVKTNLEEKGIKNPNIFPLTAGAALEQRIDDDEADYLPNFIRKTSKYPVMRFHDYYSYSHLPRSSRNKIEERLQDATEEEKMIIYSGITNIEEAICLYINKYSRTIKIKKLVDAFNGKLKELSAVEKIKDAIQKDQAAKAAIDKNIEIIQANINSAEQAQTLSKTIDSLDLTHDVEIKIKEYRKSVERKIDTLYRHEKKMPKDDAVIACEEIQKECKELDIQIKVKIEDLLQKSFNKTINDILKEYRKHLSSLNLGIDKKALDVLPLNLVAGSLADLGGAIKKSTKTVKEKVGEIDVEKEVTLMKKKTNWFWTPWNWGSERYEPYTKKITEKKPIYESSDYVDMQAFSDTYLDPFVVRIQESTEQSLEYVKNETERLKNYLKKELLEIDKLLKQKLSDLKDMQSASQLKQEDVAKKEANLKWLQEMEQSVNEIINF